MLVFWTEDLGVWDSKETGMKIYPIECIKTDNTRGFYLGLSWKKEVESRGVTTSLIKKSDLKQRKEAV